MTQSLPGAAHSLHAPGTKAPLAGERGRLSPASGHQRPKLLDLFCGAGGAAKGYHDAGFDVVGVDIVPQPRYPYEFRQWDVPELLAWHAHHAERGWPFGGFDAIHASPPCQLWSVATLSQRRNGREYPDLITPVRPLLETIGLPWVMECVPEAPLRRDLLLCGCMLGLGLDGLQLQRPRSFEMSWHPELLQQPHQHDKPAISIAGHGTPAWQRRITGHVPVAAWREVMGISWMRREELTEAIPPAYTGHVGRLLLEHLHARKAAAGRAWADLEAAEAGRLYLAKWPNGKDWRAP